MQRCADHHFGEVARRLLARIARTHDLAEPQDRGAVAEGPDLFELVRDVEDRRALRRKLLQRFEKDVDLLRGQDAGRLVHD
jgi:hypothetical protein